MKSSCIIIRYSFVAINECIIVVFISIVTIIHNSYSKYLTIPNIIIIIIIKVPKAYKKQYDYGAQGYTWEHHV